MRLAVDRAFVGDPTVMRLCIERMLPPCHERAVKFTLPPIESAADIAPAMKAVTSALAGGVITPGEAARIAALVDTHENGHICAVVRAWPIRSGRDE